jgi:nucleoside-diphosphate-sugar epimerase
VYLAATEALLPKGRLDARAFNIGTGKGTSVIEIAELLQEVAGTKVSLEFAPHRPGEQQESFINADKAHELLGWAPQVTLPEGLAMTFAWFEQHVGGVAV